MGELFLQTSFILVKLNYPTFVRCSSREIGACGYFAKTL